MDRWEGITEGGSYLGTSAPGMSGHGTTTDVQGIRGRAAIRWGGVGSRKGKSSQKGVGAGGQAGRSRLGVQVCRPGARSVGSKRQCSARALPVRSSWPGPFNCPGPFATVSSRGAAAVEEQHRSRARGQAVMLSWYALRCLLSRRS